MFKNNLPAYDYSGDAELQRLKVDFDDEEQPNNVILNETASGQDSNSNMKFEENDGIEENEMTSVRDNSSGISSCSGASSDSFTKNGEKKFENGEPLCQDNNSTTDVNKAGNSDETLQLKNAKGAIAGEDENCRNDSNDLLKQENDEKIDSTIHPRAVFKTLPPELKGTIKFRESKLWEFIIPLIGKSVDWGKDQNPMPFDAELAARINQQNFINNGGPRQNTTSFQEYIRKKLARTKEEIEEEDRRLELRAARMATYVLGNTVRILLQMESDEPNEDKIVKYFYRFLRLPISPFDMIHMPQFVRTVMFVKGCPEFSKRVRDIARECFDKIHVLFPIPPGYNFITVYTNEVEKCLPFDCDKMSDYPLVYESSENEDSENESENSENESEDSAFCDDQDVND